MQKKPIRTGLIATALGAAAILAAVPAQAQNDEFWKMERRSVQVEINRAVARVEDLHTQLRSVPDNATGCRLSRSLRSTLTDLQIHSEKMANINARLGNDEGHRAAVDLHNAALAERKRLEDGVLAQCANLGF